MSTHELQHVYGTHKRQDFPDAGYRGIPPPHRRLATRSAGTPFPRGSNPASRGAWPQSATRTQGGEMTALEVWREVPGLPDYEASSLGRIRRRTASRTAPVGYVMKWSVDRFGYAKITLSSGGRERTTQVHRIIAETFLGPCPSPRHEVAHWDGNHLNCEVGNLRWATALENAADRARHGRTHGAPPGERHHDARLTAEQVLEIRAASARGVRGCDLAIMFDVSRPTISDIVNRRTWTSI
jgi:hypothetical protein